jgi:hypothetical protein
MVARHGCVADKTGATGEIAGENGSIVGTANAALHVGLLIGRTMIPTTANTYAARFGCATDVSLRRMQCSNHRHEPQSLSLTLDPLPSLRAAGEAIYPSMNVLLDCFTAFAKTVRA